MEESSPSSQRSTKILTAIILAAGTFLASILLWRRRSRPAGVSRPIRKKLLRNIGGLSETEAESRRQDDLDNTINFKPVRTRTEIWRENVLSIFNLSLVGLAVLQLLFNRPLDALISLGVLCLNIGLNVFQEYFARRRIKDVLQDTRPRVTVIRDQTTHSIDTNEIVVGDMVAIGPGDELLADGAIVYQDDLVVDESMLGEGDLRATKDKGEQVFAGTFCVSGRAVYQVKKVGDDRYITGLIEKSEDAQIRLTPIEKIINRVLRVLLIIMAFFTVFLVYTYLNIDLPIPETVFNELAGIIFSIAPAGIFFMIIVTYAAGTVDLARVGALVYRARSVEALAQVNTICFSREGILTGMQVDMAVSPQSEEREIFAESRIRQMLGDYVRSSLLDNQLTRAIEKNFDGNPREAIDEAPYLSVYGWTAITFDDPDLSGVYVLGVPAALEPYLINGSPLKDESEEDQPGQVRKLFTRLGRVFNRPDEKQADPNNQDNLEEQPSPSNNPEAPIEAGKDTSDSETGKPTKPSLFRRSLNQVSQMAQEDEEKSQDQGSQGLSTNPPIELIFAYYPDPGPLFDEKGSPQFPIPLIPLCSLTFAEQIRPEAIPVIKSFSDDGIEVKIFTPDQSDHAIDLLKKAGLREQSLNTISGIDLSSLDTDEYVQAAAENGIFQKLTPEQMKLVVANLRAGDQYVAMVGDSVNDVPALSQANLAVTYQSSSQAAQSMADILLLENSLQVLERVLDKGQRIVNGLLDILKLYLTQVSYLALLILAIQIMGFGFPLHGIQLTVVTIFTITIPALGLTLWANPGVLYGKSIRKSLGHFVVPAAITISIAGAFSFYYFRTVSDDRIYAHLADTYVLVFTGLLVVLFLRPPFHILTGGAPVSEDRRIFYMVVVLTGLFLLILTLSTAIPFLQDLLKLTWLDSISDFIFVILIVAVWAFVLLLTWRVWRLEGIWNNQQVTTPVYEEMTNSEPIEHPDRFPPTKG